MEWTDGMIRFVCGISGGIISVLAMLVSSQVFRRKRKSLMKKIENELQQR